MRPRPGTDAGDAHELPHEGVRQPCRELVMCPAALADQDVIQAWIDEGVDDVGRPLQIDSIRATPYKATPSTKAPM